jgi:hypothetical protein
MCFEPGGVQADSGRDQFWHNATIARRTRARTSSGTAIIEAAPLEAAPLEAAPIEAAPHRRDRVLR